MAVCASIALHANASHIGKKHNRTLPDIAIKASSFEFIAGNQIGMTQYL
jgi:hypothetical protein